MLCSTFLTIEYIKGNNRSTLPSHEVNLKTRLTRLTNLINGSHYMLEHLKNFTPKNQQSHDSCSLLFFYRIQPKLFSSHIFHLYGPYCGGKSAVHTRDLSAESLLPGDILN